MKISTCSLAFVLLPSLSLACPEHTIVRDIAGANLAKRADPGTAWSYDRSYDWHILDSKNEMCQTGTQQSPIGLKLDQGLSVTHVPHFEFPGRANKKVNGTFKNWGYGPAFDVKAGMPKEEKPTMQFDDVKTYMSGWHTHAPADHSAGGDRSKAELHIVWNDWNSDMPRAVTGVRLDAGRTNSTFFDQFSSFDRLISYNDTRTKNVELDFGTFLGNSYTPGYFGEFWTYEGSLTSPPCMEGIRWFVARNIHWVNTSQMQKILAVSKFSARPEQEVWMHGVNA